MGVNDRVIFWSYFFSDDAEVSLQATINITHFQENARNIKKQNDYQII